MTQTAATTHRIVAAVRSHNAAPQEVSWHATAAPDNVAIVVTTPVTADPDADLLARLRRGDELAFRTLVQRHNATMLRVARLHVRESCNQFGSAPWP